MYARAHKHTQNVVERGIGQMKRRFHVLHGEIRLTPEMMMMMMMMAINMTMNLAVWNRVDWHLGITL